MNLVSNEMSRRVAFATETDDIREIHRRMSELGIRHVPIVRGRKLVGMISHRDILLYSKPGPGGTIVVPSKVAGEIMSKELVTCYATDTVATCVDKILENQIGSLPVLDFQGELVGIVTTSDLLRLLRSREYEPERKLPFHWSPASIFEQWGNWRPANY